MGMKNIKFSLKVLYLNTLWKNNTQKSRTGATVYMSNGHNIKNQDFPCKSKNDGN